MLKQLLSLPFLLGLLAGWLVLPTVVRMLSARFGGGV